jgi:flagellar motility protein MotE (MotC chaperone)
MKKLIISCQIIIMMLFIMKILFFTEAIHKTSLFSAWPGIYLDQAIAQPPTSINPALNHGDIADDDLRKERDLFVLLQKKQKELEARENAIKSEEQKLIALKGEIIQKIDMLKLLEAQLSPMLDNEKTNDAKRLKDLAKVYEAAPPEKAAAAIEKLGVKTAATLTINMKRDRAGSILGYLSPQKAVDITNEITRTVRSSSE